MLPACYMTALAKVDLLFLFLKLTSDSLHPIQTLSRSALSSKAWSCSFRMNNIDDGTSRVWAFIRLDESHVNARMVALASERLSKWQLAGWLAVAGNCVIDWSRSDSRTSADFGPLLKLGPGYMQDLPVDPNESRYSKT